jgi:hypothetical protein
VRSEQQFPCGLPGTPGNVPKTWGGQIGDSPGLDAAGVLATAVLEMQPQSCGGVIRVFPAWPMGWQSEFTLAVMHSECSVGPKWPFHQGLGDTVEAHLKRSDFFGMLGIAKDGLNPTRNKVQKALADQQAKATAKK